VGGGRGAVKGDGKPGRGKALCKKHNLDGAVKRKREGKAEKEIQYKCGSASAAGPGLQKNGKKKRGEKAGKVG